MPPTRVGENVRREARDIFSTDFPDARHVQYMYNTVHHYSNPMAPVLHTAALSFFQESRDFG